MQPGRSAHHPAGRAGRTRRQGGRHPRDTHAGMPACDDRGGVGDAPGVPGDGLCGPRHDGAPQRAHRGRRSGPPAESPATWSTISTTSASDGTVPTSTAMSRPGARHSTWSRGFVSMSPRRTAPSVVRRRRTTAAAMFVPSRFVVAAVHALEESGTAVVRRPLCPWSKACASEHPRRENHHWSGFSGAEGVGFEPTEARASTVFKTVAFVRSAIPPERDPRVRLSQRT